MANRQLLLYIREQLKRGYSIEAIRATLLRSGYPPNEIDSSLRAAQRGPVVAIVFVILLVSAVFGISIFFLFRAEPVIIAPPQVGLTLTETEVRAGDTLGFTLIVESGEPLPTEGSLRSSILDENGNTILSKEEIILVRQNATINRSLALPSTVVPGSYRLVAQVSLVGAFIETVASFRVSERGTGVQIVGGETVPIQTVIEHEQQIREIVALARDDPAQARELCLELEQAVADQCLLEAGLSVNDELFCASIQNDDKRDTCYFNLVLVTRKSGLCSSITNENLRNTCVKI